MKKRVALLGCTGSIGRSAQKVLDQGDFSVVFLSNNSDLEGLKNLIAKYKPTLAVCLERNYMYRHGREYPLSPDFSYTPDLFSDVDVVINGIVGLAGLEPTLSAIRAGKIVATANKESFVCAGALINAALRESTAKIYPLDSEHSAVWQLLQNGRTPEKIYITASGGAFRDLTKEELRFAKAADALKHPTWKMGKKVTIDCATLVNKGMELIEAKHLFGLPTEAIGHRESIVHALVRYSDGSYFANLSAPDMVTPISYALHYPAPSSAVNRPFDLAECSTLSFFKPDEERFPALTLAKRAVLLGDKAGCVFHAADDVLVKRYLADEIGFCDLNDGLRAAMDKFAEPGDFSSVDAVFRIYIESDVRFFRYFRNRFHDLYPHPLRDGRDRGVYFFNAFELHVTLIKI